MLYPLSYGSGLPEKVTDELRHRPVCRSGLVLEERAHVVAVELLAAGEEFKLDDEGEADHGAAELFDETDDGRSRDERP